MHVLVTHARARSIALCISAFSLLTPLTPLTPLAPLTLLLLTASTAFAQEGAPPAPTTPPEPPAPSTPSTPPTPPAPPTPAPDEPPPIEPRDDDASADEPDADDDCVDEDGDDVDDCADADDGDGDGDGDGDDDDGDGDNGITVGPADDDDDPAALASESRVTLGGRLGAAAGNVGAVPFFLPGPGAFFTASERLVAFDLLFAGVDGGMSFGINEQSDATSIAGYKARMFAGARLSLDWFTLDADVHGGVTSVALLPVPRVGAGLEGKLAMPVCCEDETILTLDAEGRFDADLLLIAPAPAANVEAGFTWYLGPAFLRGRAGIDADAVVAVLYNSISASVFVSLTAGLDLALID